MMVAHIFTLLLAHFASKLVSYWRHSETVNFRKNSEIDVIFLRKQRFHSLQTFFKDTLCLQKLTNLDAKGAKRSVKMCKSFFKNILVYMNGPLSKIRSVYTYGVMFLWVIVLGCIWEKNMFVCINDLEILNSWEK